MEHSTHKPGINQLNREVRAMGLKIAFSWLIGILIVLIMAL